MFPALSRQKKSNSLSPTNGSLGVKGSDLNSGSPLTNRMPSGPRSIGLAICRLKVKTGLQAIGAIEQVDKVLIGRRPALNSDTLT